MRRALTIAAFGAIAIALLCSADASAAVDLGFTEATHEPSSIPPGTFHRGDEQTTYSLRLKNTGTTPTVGTTHLSLSFPPGVMPAAAKSTGWVCDLADTICTTSQTVAAGGEYPLLRIVAWILPAAPETIEAGFEASGAGAGSTATAQDILVLGPERQFGPTGTVAGACTAPPVEVAVLSCAEAEEHGAIPLTAAGGHPFAASTSFAIPMKLGVGIGEHALDGNPTSVQNLHDLFTELPPGFIGNPENVHPACTVNDVRETSVTARLCPESAAVGGALVTFSGVGSVTPIYRVVPEAGYAAAFGFLASNNGGPVTIVIRIKLRSNGDYGVSAISPVIPQAVELKALNFATLCGYGVKTVPGSHIPLFAGCRYPGTPGSRSVPFLTNPTDCASGEPITSVIMDSYQARGALDPEGNPLLSDLDWKVGEARSPAIVGCHALTESWVGEGPEPHRPSLSFAPDGTRAASPAAYTAHLHIPQEGLINRGGLATAHPKDTTAALPRGVALNPAAAQGLGACTEAQAGYLGDEFPMPNPMHFSTVSEGCPDDSKLGTVSVTTPLLDKALQGSIYLAAQRKNPFGSDFALYLVIDDEETGIKATLAGKVIPSESEEGRITASFDDNPQVPVEDLDVSFFSGDRASLLNPDVCGSYTTSTSLSPWSAADPAHPLTSEVAVSESPLTIDHPAPGQSACPASKAARPFQPGFSAGASDPTAGAHSPFSLRVDRAARFCGNPERGQTVFRGRDRPGSCAQHLWRRSLGAGSSVLPGPESGGDHHGWGWLGQLGRPGR
jgi:hypothetical protein